MPVDFSYCGHNETVLPAWQDGGFRPCFLATTESMTLFLFAFFFCGVVAAWPLRREFAPAKSVRSPHMYVLLACSLLAVGAAMAHLAIVTVGHHAAVQYVVVTDTLTAFAWFLAFQPIRRAYKGKQPLHLVNAIFATGALIFCAMEAASIRSDAYFFKSPTRNNAALLAAYCVRAAAVLAYAVLAWYLWLKHHCTCMQGRAAREGYTAINVDADDMPTVTTRGAGAGTAAAAGHKGQDASGKPTAHGGSGASAASTTTSAHLQGTVDEREGTTFSDFGLRMRVIWPFLWPKGKPLLQLRVLVCLVLLALGRVVNLYVPISYKLIVDKLTPTSAKSNIHASSPSPSPSSWLDGGLFAASGVSFPVGEILIYVGLRFLSGGGSGGMGVLNNLRSFLWITVQQYTSRISRVDTFEHLHSLSLRWHLSRKTGEVLQMVDRGTSSISSLLSYVLFNILPTLVDIAIACVYFTSSFGPYFGLTVFVTMMLYIYFTIVVTEWRTKFRRGMNTRDNQLRQMVRLLRDTPCLLTHRRLSWHHQLPPHHTPPPFCDCCYGVARVCEGRTSISIAHRLSTIVGVDQILVQILPSLTPNKHPRSLSRSFRVCVLQSYVVQLYAPLNFFGTYYRMIQSSLIDMENMFDLLQVTPEVKDDPNAEELQVSTGRHGCSIEFRNVSFSYEPRKLTLKNISFKVEPGKSIALVGSSGSGKSTIMRLLFRFYDVQQGQILVDGKDVSKITQRSLRAIMGVVPQDTVLFNDTIRYNIRYARPDCSEEEIIEAAKAAEIHNAILSFPDGYDTVVGERGLKLSGGEKQRVAISRAVLKAPQVILLDEATSALDTETERSIQRSLNSSRNRGQPRQE
ncbi:ATP-binding cassette sub-family B member 6 [Salpingoeca rosetta]|uniref:ATP-binding cassette sub-family B member 6 n=1 Tax=Salpingoeca rosetta (strain ATCC 50818 / BSB-021) TaxID=946362 RepID=F2UNN4_SALR5|nr:ATP-binding cassette sub-family B member 6 [Salpingoeca rosetta]EGD79239.1 ATP-binding cassette sub-family B member 6 [Salpingoeca rosetta]|eukprot:XP_004989324.1 ATP-binding cassette sub-family B member 6 [Salpingoeca rosetta]